MDRRHYKIAFQHPFLMFLHATSADARRAADLLRRHRLLMVRNDGRVRRIHQYPTGGRCMLFNDPLFLFIFLPAALCASIVARRLWGARAVLGVLVLASIVFYGWWNPIYLPLLGGLALFNFVFARWIVAALMAERRSRVRLLLTIGIVVDLAVLAYFKYTDFFIGTANT